MKKLKLIILVLLQNYIGIAQLNQTQIDLATAEMKYWKLRGRLTGDENNFDKFSGFISVGNAKGQSIVFNKRPKNDGWDSEWVPGNTSIKPGICTPQFNGVTPINFTTSTANLFDPRDGKPLTGRMEMGENPLIMQGYYLAVLATEWALLNRDGQSTAATERELFFALNAINRLDAHAETQYASQPLVNGFLARDDAYDNLAMDVFGTSFDLVKSNNACPVGFDVPTKPNGNPTAEGLQTIKKMGRCQNVLAQKPTSIRVNVMSLDEVVGVLYGMMYVKKFVGVNATFNNINLVNLNAGISDRIIKFVRGGNLGNWVIKDPVTNRPVCLGATAWAVSAGISAMGKFISGNNFSNPISLSLGFAISTIMDTWWSAAPGLNTNAPPPIMINFQPVCSVLEIDPSFCGGQPVVLFNAQALPTPPIYNNDIFMEIVSTTGFMPTTIFGPATPKFVKKAIISGVAQNNHMELADLVSSVFINYKPHFPMQFWLDKFNEMECHGSCYQINNPGVWQGCSYFEDDTINLNNTWNTDFRFWCTKDIRPSFLQYDIDEVIKYPNNLFFKEKFTEYNSLDYMLAFNMFKLKFFANGTTNKIRRNFSNNIPFATANNTILGTTSKPFILKSVYQVISNAKISSNGNAKFSAGSDIKLNPGFLANAGSVFSATIKDYDCAPTFAGSAIMNKSANDTIPDEFYFEDADTAVNPLLNDTSDLINPINSNPLNDCFIVQYVNDTFYIIPNPKCTFTDSGQVYINNSSKELNDVSFLFDAKVFPNPTQDEINLAFYLFTEANYEVKLFDNFGQNLSEYYISKQNAVGEVKHIFNIKNLAAGLYYIDLKINGRRQLLKFVKM